MGNLKFRQLTSLLLLTCCAAVGSVEAQVTPQAGPAKSPPTAVAYYHSLISNFSLSANVHGAYQGDAYHEILKYSVVTKKGLIHIEERVEYMLPSEEFSRSARKLLYMIMVRPDRHVTYTFLPERNAYVEEPLLDRPSDPVKAERQVLGQETKTEMDCDKVLYKLTDRVGQITQVVIWEARQAKGLPVAMETTDARGKLEVYLDRINLFTFGDEWFAPPSNATRCATHEQLIALIGN